MMPPSDREATADFDTKIRRSTRDRLATITGKLTWDERVVHALDRAEDADKLEEALRKIREGSRCWGWDFHPDDLEKIASEALGDAASQEGDDGNR